MRLQVCADPFVLEQFEFRCEPSQSEYEPSRFVENCWPTKLRHLQYTDWRIVNRYNCMYIPELQSLRNLLISLLFDNCSAFRPTDRIAFGGVITIPWSCSHWTMPDAAISLTTNQLQIIINILVTKENLNLSINHFTYNGRTNVST